MKFEPSLFHWIDVEVDGEREPVFSFTHPGVFDEEVLAETIRDAQRNLKKGNIIIRVAACTYYKGKDGKIKYEVGRGYPIPIHFESDRIEYYDRSQQATLRFSDVDSLIAWFKNKKYGGRILDIAAEAAKDWLMVQIRKREMEAECHVL